MTAFVKSSHEVTIPNPKETHYPVYAGAPVRGKDWQRMADVANSIAGIPVQRVPVTYIDQQVSAGGSVTLEFRSASQGTATHRVWTVQFQAPGAAVVGTVQGEDFSYNTGPAEISVIESQTRGSSSDALTLTVTVDAASPAVARILFVSCYDLPRGELQADTTDYGVAQTSCARHAAIIDQGAGESVRGVDQAIAQLETRLRRNMLQWSTTTNGILGLSATDSTTFQELGGSIVLAPSFEAAATRAAETWAYASGNGEVRISALSGDSVTIAFASGSYTWTQGSDLDVAAENLANTGGTNPDGTQEQVLIEYRSTDGNTFGVRGVSLIGG